ncbi:hypothetical protein [Nitrosomonas aestuarii]|uniref:hypothetical protein n=1 Tax=Nitrosomonas aestuarii TaxID=52441 RepID=UPI000D470DB0|nr:hypothetical protein C8R11_10956 [Nitrosomonas aestuarii]
MDRECKVLASYKELLFLMEDKFVMLEACTRRLIAAEELNQDEVDKLLRRPSAVKIFRRKIDNYFIFLKFTVWTPLALKLNIERELS